MPPFFRLMGIIPLGIGVTVLGFLWLSPWNEFGSPPLFFRIFGSFVALGFVMTGIGSLSGMLGPNDADVKDAINAFHRQVLRKDPPLGRPPETNTLDYVCRHCNTPLGRNADVSPLGDVKCNHCGKWFNIHGRGV